ncbi:hypothetical protein AVEN_219229-1 [Araneus ventricosus]|uniref:Uncharacterized protein n=1 Tax=Araneus ventricosus TaxID=182803 RepID=A0A4Y2HPY3_ARAVE|nr:hypothetical protein AVEN_219229-1 [Araneus ventricosus]
MDSIAYKMSIRKRRKKASLCEFCDVRLFVQSIRTEGGNKIRKNKPKHDKMSDFLLSFTHLSLFPPSGSTSGCGIYTDDTRADCFSLDLKLRIECRVTTIIVEDTGR